MHRVIDTPWNTAHHLPQLATSGVKTLIRFFNHRNSKKLPEKGITRDEALAIGHAGLSLCTVFQQRSGAFGHIRDLSAATGHKDAQRAVDLADWIEQPEQSAIYFAVGFDYTKPEDMAAITDYFAAVSNVLDGRYRLGVFASGAVARKVLDAKLADFVWLAAAKGWSGTMDMLKTSDWALYQNAPAIKNPVVHCANTVSQAWSDFGQFSPGGTPASQARQTTMNANRGILIKEQRRSASTGVKPPLGRVGNSSAA
ncbi:MAG: glycoside hydrolase domain-containing protein [Pseudomonadota bacterium]